MPGELTVVVNTGDDLELHSLAISPDQDTVLYTLAGIADPKQGWGIAGETWQAMNQLARLGEETWFRLGDRDLATHLFRTERLRRGARPTEVALELARSLGVSSRVLPMSDERVRTRVRTAGGWLDFQDYFVRLHQEPDVLEVDFDGAAEASMTPEVREAIRSAEAIVVAPSNPVVSIGPILAVPGMLAEIVAARRRGVPAVAVSGIIGGKALRGPADRMMAGLGEESSALGVARRYAEAALIDIFLLDREDEGLAAQVRALGVEVLVTDTVMTDADSRVRLAREMLAATVSVGAGARGRSRGRRRTPAPDDRAGARGDHSGMTPTRLTKIVALIPVRSLSGGKSRLGEPLDAEERAALVLALLQRTVEAALAATRLAGVVVVSMDEDLLRGARAMGAATLLQRTDGLNEALDEARIAAGAAATAVMVLPADLPGIAASAIDRLAEAADLAPHGAPEKPVVALVPDQHGTGTNALLVAPPNAIPFCFGEGSRAAHAAAARAAGASYLELDGPLTFDLDTPDDLLEADLRGLDHEAGR
jgi:LPPG:FO 2-phospho-L-lactate transferase